MAFAVQRKKRLLLEVVCLGHCEHFLVRVLSEITLSRVSQRKMPEIIDKKTARKQTDR